MAHTFADKIIHTDCIKYKPVGDLVRAPPQSKFKFCGDPICRQCRRPLYQNIVKQDYELLEE